MRTIKLASVDHHSPFPGLEDSRTLRMSMSPSNRYFERTLFSQPQSLRAGCGHVQVENIGLSDVTIKALHARNVKALFPIQKHVFDPAMQGRDLVARAKTGSGKTLAFSLPVIESLLKVGSSPLLPSCPSHRLSVSLSQVCFQGGSKNRNGRLCNKVAMVICKHATLASWVIKANHAHSVVSVRVSFFAWCFFTVVVPCRSMRHTEAAPRGEGPPAASCWRQRASWQSRWSGSFRSAPPGWHWAASMEVT